MANGAAVAGPMPSRSDQGDVSPGFLPPSSRRVLPPSYCLLRREAGCDHGLCRQPAKASLQASPERLPGACLARLEADAGDAP